MTGPDTFNAICGAMTLCAGGFALWLNVTKAQLRLALVQERATGNGLRDQLLEAQRDQAEAEAACTKAERRYFEADNARRTAIAALDKLNATHMTWVRDEPARIEQAIKDRRRSHLKEIGDKGRAKQAALRSGQEA